MNYSSRQILLTPLVDFISPLGKELHQDLHLSGCLLARDHLSSPGSTLGSIRSRSTGESFSPAETIGTWMAPEGPQDSGPSLRYRDHIRRNLESYYGRDNMRNVVFENERREGKVWTGCGTVEVRDHLIFGVQTHYSGDPSLAAEEKNVFTKVPFRSQIDLETGDTNVHAKRMDDMSAENAGLSVESPQAPTAGLGTSKRTPNDQRSDVFNPTSPDYKAAQDNRANQLNPNNLTSHRSRGKK